MVYYNGVCYFNDLSLGIFSLTYTDPGRILSHRLSLKLSMFGGENQTGLECSSPGDVVFRRSERELTRRSNCNESELQIAAQFEKTNSVFAAPRAHSYIPGSGSNNHPELLDLKGFVLIL